jgi:mannose-6-phosphate isomerase-like protein (cupin superfamily)
MATKGQILDLTPVGMKFTVLQTSADTQGKSLELHWELLPGCNMKDPLIHIHPDAVETYEVLEGEMEFFIQDKWVKARVGDKLEIQKGVTHGFRNPTSEVVRVFNTHQPALCMEHYFEDVSKVLDKVTNERRKPFEMNLRTLLYMGLLQDNYRAEIIAKSPPDGLIKVVGWLARRLHLRY